MTKSKQKREVRSYKITDKFYFKAQKRAAKEKITLGKLLEMIVRAYADNERGYDFIDKCGTSTHTSETAK
jgi:hypothetical protein